jgi:hypothetical protein
MEDCPMFGVPWPKGLYRHGQKFIIEVNAEQYPLDSREIAITQMDGTLCQLAYWLRRELYCERCQQSRRTKSDYYR